MPRTTKRHYAIQRFLGGMFLPFNAFDGSAYTPGTGMLRDAVLK